MRQRSQRNSRRSIRLKEFDYRRSGAYFITVKTHNQRPLFGNIVDGIMYLNEMGLQVDRVWHEIPERFPWVDIDAFQIMPDHIHGIIWIRHQRVTEDKSDEIRRGESHSPLILSHVDRTYVDTKNRKPDFPTKHMGEWDSHKHTGEWDSPKHAGEWDLPKHAGEWDSPLRSQSRNIVASLNVASRPCGTSKTVGSVVRGIKIPVTQWARNHPGVWDVWQRNYFEHIIRSQQSLERIRRYIRDNPMQWQVDHDRRCGYQGEGR